MWTAKLALMNCGKVTRLPLFANRGSLVCIVDNSIDSAIICIGQLWYIDEYIVVDTGHSLKLKPGPPCAYLSHCKRMSA